MLKPSHPVDDVDGVVIGGAGGHDGIVCDSSSQNENDDYMLVLIG